MGSSRDVFFFRFGTDAYAEPVSTEFSANNESAVEHIINSHYTSVALTRSP